MSARQPTEPASSVPRPRRLPARLLPLLGLLVACGGAGALLYDEDRATSNAPIGAGVEAEALRGGLADGQRALREGDVAAARRHLEAYLQQEPKSWTAHYHLGLVHMEAGGFDLARAHLERAVALQPALYGGWSNLGVLYLEHGEEQAALNALEQAHMVAPKDVRVLVNLGNARLRRGQWSDAIDAYQAALVEAPNHASALYNLGLAYSSRQRWAQALEAVDKAMVYRPGYAQARALRVVALSHLGRIAEAIAEGEADLERIRPQVENHVALGRALLLAGRKGDATERLREAAALEPSSPLARMTLGEVLDAAGDKAGAIAQYEAYLKLPKRRFEDARRLRRRQRELQAGAGA